MANHPRTALALLDDAGEPLLNDAGTRSLRARILVALGRHEEAAAHFEQALRSIQNPEPDLVFELTDCLRQCGQLDKALTCLEEALRSRPGLPALVEKAVAIELECGRPARAALRMQALAEAAAIKEPLLAKQAALLAMAGDTEASLRVWRELHARIALMPPAQRHSHAMSLLNEQALNAIAALVSISTTPPSQP